ncbi:MAG TPA: DoxX family membrane protein [Pyrinomonadaceae bacterium]|jgi:uncharacterized membrane protein YphA (DoxX/SURF4 family)
MRRLGIYATVLLRLALGVAFLSAVADRFGLWGAHGAPGVSWGDFERFTAYTAVLNWFMPGGLIPLLAWTATIVEVALGVSLILGLYTRASALLSGLLLLLFAAAMTLALGVKAPLNYSVFTAAAAAFLLAAQPSFEWSVDSLVRHRRAKNALGLRAARWRGRAGAPKGATPVSGNA